MQSFTRSIWIAIHFHFIRTALISTPRWLATRFNDSWLKIVLFCEDLSRKAITQSDEGEIIKKEPSEETIFDRLLTNNVRLLEKGQAAKSSTPQELADESTAILNAGTEPTATMMAYAYGCEVTDAKGDVGDVDIVRGVFRSARPEEIAGVIQGVMVLRRNYAAANTFLDAFADYRRALGLNANTVDWGVIEDVGYLAEQDSGLETRFDKSQWTPINKSMLRRIINYSILQQQSGIPVKASSTAQLITGLAYPLKPNSSDLVEERRFGYLFNGPSATSADDLSDGNDQTDEAIKAFHIMHSSAANMAALVKVLVEVLQMRMTKVLRLEIEFDPGRPLMIYGLDSLSAVEIAWLDPAETRRRTKYARHH
ncbi:MAG: hypothetical protein MMC23_002874 [Stictis urceolatum]|nr:hypothetical protein [Stictis urceolata]